MPDILGPDGQPVHIPFVRRELTDNEKLPNVDYQLGAAFLAARFVIRVYLNAGFTAWNCRNRLEQRMKECRKAGLWDAKHYNYVAALYREAILEETGQRVEFHYAKD